MIFTGKNPDFLPLKNPNYFSPLLDYLPVQIDMSATDDRLTPAFK